MWSSDFRKIHFYHWRGSAPKPSHSGEGGAQSGSSEPICVTDEGRGKHKFRNVYETGHFHFSAQSADWGTFRFCFWGEK